MGTTARTEYKVINWVFKMRKVLLCVMGNQQEKADWWLEHVPHGCALQLMKSMYGTRQAARQWHVLISTWMEDLPGFNSQRQRTALRLH